LQPGQEPSNDLPRYRTSGVARFLDFPFNSSQRMSIENGMAGNLSVRRDVALRIGGFDESFVGVAYRFETEFCRRLCAHGGRIRFEPAATIRHLRAPSGGTRTHGDHRTSASPLHGVGDYYFALRQGANLGTLGYILRRPFQEVCTRFHLRHPWWIPVKCVGEMRAFLRALRLSVSGPRLLKPAATGKS
jgi:GT2 family glycosyltransferase